MAKGTAGALDRLRTLCLSYPETSEASSWGRPHFRAGKKTFLAFEQVGGRPSIALRLPPSEIERLLTVLRHSLRARPVGQHVGR